MATTKQLDEQKTPFAIALNGKNSVNTEDFFFNYKFMFSAINKFVFVFVGSHSVPHPKEAIVILKPNFLNFFVFHCNSLVPVVVIYSLKWYLIVLKSASLSSLAVYDQTNLLKLESLCNLRPRAFKSHYYFSFSLFPNQCFIQTDFGHVTNNKSHILNET